MGTRGDDVRKRREERKAKAGELQAAIAEQVAALTESDRWEGSGRVASQRPRVSDLGHTKETGF